MGQQVITIARFTMLEALRTRLLRLYLVAFVAVLLISFFVQQLALTESARFQISFFAVGIRLVSIFVLSLYVIGSVIRECNDKGQEIVLAMNLSRSRFVIGKLIGYYGIAIIVGVVASLPLFALSSWESAVAWGLSLVFELWILSTLSLFSALVLTQFAASVGFVLGFYLLSRSMAAIKLIAGAELFDQGEVTHKIMGHVIDGLALVLPRFDLFTQTAWLIQADQVWNSFGTIVVQTMVFAIVLISATIFDMQRKSF
jgi:hypothetical protein